MSVPRERTVADVRLGTGLGVLTGVALAGVGLATSPYLALAALAAGLVGLALLVRPELGLVLAAVVVPIERLGRFTDDTATVPISLMRVVGTVVFAVFVLHFVVRRRRPHLGRQGLLLLVFTGLVGGSLLYSTDPTNTTRGLSLWLGNLMFFLLIVNGVQSLRMARRLLAVTLVSATLVGGLSLYQWRFQDQLLTGEAGHNLGQFETKDRFSGVFEDATEFEAFGGRPRLAGPTSHPTVYATNLLCLLPIAVFFARRWRGLPTRLFLVGTFVCLGLSLILTGTRAAVLVAAILLVVLVVAGLIRIRPVAVALLLLACVTVPWVTPASVSERIFNWRSYTPERAAALRVRLSYWQSGLEIMADHWLLGVGFGNLEELPKRNAHAPREGSSLHNSLLYLGMELGAVGLALWLWFLGELMRNVVRARRAFAARGRGADALLTAALGVAVLGPILLGVTVDWHHFPNKVWWLAVGLLEVLRRIAEGTLPEREPEPLLPVLAPSARLMATAGS